MTNLTDKWKKGELPDGKYYMENTSGIIGMVGHSKVFPCYNVKQILAPVPTFEEWQAKLEENEKLKTENKWYSEQLNEAVKKIDKLKELLTECRECVDENLEFSKSIGRNRIQPRNKGLLKRIDEALK